MCDISFSHFLIFAITLKINIFYICGYSEQLITHQSHGFQVWSSFRQQFTSVNWQIWPGMTIMPSNDETTDNRIMFFDFPLAGNILVQIISIHQNSHSEWLFAMTVLTQSYFLLIWSLIRLKQKRSNKQIISCL